MQLARHVTNLDLLVQCAARLRLYTQIPTRNFTKKNKEFAGLTWDSIQPNDPSVKKSFEDAIQSAEKAAQRADEAAMAAATEALLSASQRHLSLLPEDVRFLSSGMSPLAPLSDDKAAMDAAATTANQQQLVSSPHWGRISMPAAQPEQTAQAKRSPEQQPLNPTYADCAKRDWARVFLLPPTNPWQELIQLTAEGKLWHYPIDNEQGRESEPEGRVSFQQHVMLEKQMQDWLPKSGPVRHFMETVCVGLSKNPHLTAAEKADHLDWYRRYFADKMGQIHAAYEQAAEPNQA